MAIDTIKEYGEKAGKSELASILKKELPSRLYSFKQDKIMPHQYHIYRKFPFNLVSDACAVVYIYKKDSMLKDEIVLYKEKYPLLEKLANKIAEKFSKIKGREMTVRYAN